ncbi:putative Ig domain-containing protein [Mucilaginibacter sp. BT774]|uniref:putative Ig domain-containing protein n=1 Tax=Mucilaginibacter sp. BT774 TaxID=3062276 RepID=UPI0026756322|nr:putative Ig domain-containing protein [Mucilaginibacter sp. BT774]MDO3625747.1 putative Ig domain-containing protein [Mucilaginibacter sp. BT774]
MVKRLLFFVTALVLILSSSMAMAANATLAGLSLSAGSLSPTFTSGTINYTVLESSSTSSITVTPTQTVSGSTIKINGTTVASGSASGAIALSAGSNSISIVVSRAGYSPVTYTLTVTRENISYTGSPFTFIISSLISPLTPTNTGGGSPTYSIAPTLPTGLAISPSTGVISGTPLAISSTTSYTVTADYGSGIAATTTMSIAVNPFAPAPSYSPSSNTFVVGTTISTWTPSNSGGAATGWSISPSLPTGLSFNTSTGAITGTPTAISSTATYTVTATNITGSGNTTISITVNPQAPNISYSPASNVYTVGTAISSWTPTNTGGAATSWSISPALSAGLSFNTSTGVISGTPTAQSFFTIYTVTATNVTGSSSSNINITCNNPVPPSISYSPSTNTYVVGTAISALTPTNTGGTVVSYSVSPSLPAGLSLNTSTGVISGTPTAVAATATYTVTATNAGGSGSATLTITVNPALPVISYSPSTNVYTVNTAITSLTPTNTGGAAASWSVSPTLPAGLSFDTTTGIISGTPTIVTATATYTVTATNVTGSATTTVTITITPQPPAISYTPSANIYVINTAITNWSPANTGGAATSWSITPALPAGLSFDITTGTISGTPTALSTITTYTITATNGGGSSSATIKITVNPNAPVISYTPSSNNFLVGSAITTWTPTNTGGSSTSWSIGPSLPSGLIFNTTTGAITGTPTAVSATTTYTISADNDGGVGTTTISITCVNPMPPNISYSPSGNTYTVGGAITNWVPTNSGGAAASWSISPGLPAGLSFDTTTGIISGTPTASSAATTYTITATNTVGSSTTTITISVNAQAPVISYTPSTNTYTVGTTISSLTPANTGGSASSWSISSPLPSGLSFNTSTGAISGTPTAASTSKTYTITATNVSGSATTTVTITVNSLAPSITYSPSTVTYSVGSTITPATPTNIGGAASSFSITSGTLPTGLSFDTSTGTISGTPTVTFATTTFTIKATNAQGSSSTSLIITVSPHAPVISYSPSTNAYPLNQTITSLTPNNTGGAVTGYSYSSTGTSLTGATLSGPSLMAIDASGNIYVCNYNNGTISEYNSSGTYIGKFASGFGFNNPCGIVFDSSGNAYVMDTGNGAIYKFSSSGTSLGTIASGLGHPLGIAIDASNNIYIATYNTGTNVSSVTKYSSSGSLLLTLPTTGMNQADGVAIDASGNIYVLNRATNFSTPNSLGNVTEYSPTGSYIGVFSSGYNDPLAISIDGSGNVFVADSHNNQVRIYSSGGVLLNTITGLTDVEGFVADANGNLFISDYTNNTVKKYAASGGYHISSPLPAGLSFNISTGVISGTPTVTFSPTTYTITAYNITGSGSTTVTLSCYSSFDWLGTTSSNWNTGSNWLSGTVPSSTDQALIGVNKSFTNFPNILASAGTVNVGSIQFGNTGGQAAGVVVNSGSILNVSGAITYQSDANSGSAYTTTLSGAGTINAGSISVISNTTLASSYTSTLSSSVTNLNVSGNISLTSSNSGSALFNSTFKLTAGTAAVTGAIQTTNTAGTTSSFLVVPSTTATLQLANTTALSGLSSTGTNVVTFNNTGTTIQYSGAAQTVYTSASITGLSSGISYQNISFSGTGIKTALSGNLNIAGDFTNTMANDGSNYLSLSSPTVNFNGTTQSLAGGSGNGTTFYYVTFSGAGTKTMTSGGFNVASSGVLTMSGSNAATILAANGNLTINSDATGSGSVAAISGPSITGNVNVQRYLTGGSGYRGYRVGSSPVYTATVSSNNVFSLNYLQNSMYLTGAAGGGFDKVGNPTIYLFREDITPSRTSFTSGNFLGINAINNTPSYNYLLTGSVGSGTYSIPVGNGFLFFFRGNRASASVATETVASYVPVTVTMTATGTLNQGQVVVHDWYTPSSAYLNYTGSGTGTNYLVRGFTLVGNPYASSIDWEQFNASSTTSGIYGYNVGTTIYEFNPATQNYDSYQKGGAYTNHGRRTIVSGQGFFVVANNSSNPQLIFNESAKTVNQSTGLNLFMDTQAGLNAAQIPVDEHLRLQMAVAQDSINTDDIYVGFSASYKPQFIDNEDAEYKAGNGKVSLASYTSDSVRVSINKMPLPGLNQRVIPLYASARTAGNYTLQLTELEGVAPVYEIWLIDKYNKDSVDMRKTPLYSFAISSDTNSFGKDRFQLLIRQNDSLQVKLANFTGNKSSNGSQLQWTTTNEQNYTHFTLERSTDGGANYSIIYSNTSNAQGSYSFLDRSYSIGENIYRLKIEDLNGNISYSNAVALVYTGGLNGNLTVYPNPTNGTLNLIISKIKNTSSAGSQLISSSFTTPPTVTNSYSVKIVSTSGVVIKTLSTTNPNWQTDVSSLMPGSYIVQVLNQSDNSLVGQATFVKL